jgi:opacity protein-like surface antigen
MSKLVVLVLALVVASPAFADSSRVFGVGGFVGYTEAKDADDGTHVFGGDLSLRPLDWVGGLVEVGYREDDVEVRDRTGIVTDAEIELIPVLASVQIFPFGQQLSPFAPFALGGVGWYITRAEIHGRVGEFEGSFVDHDVATGYHFGGGTDFNIGDHLTLTGDIRYVFLETDLEDVDDVDADGIRVTGGVKFFF